MVTEAFMDEAVLPKWYAVGGVLCVGFLLFVSMIRVGSLHLNWRKLYWNICMITNLAIFAEALLALGQRLPGVSLYSSCEAGSFDSITGMSSAICLCLPMGFMFYHSYTKLYKLLFLTGKTVGLLVLFLYESRTGVICLVFVLVALEYRRRRFKKWILFVMVPLVAILSASMVKISSTQGRWFIMERSMEMMAEHPVKGWGFDGYTKHYMDVQADYFATHPDSKYAMLAGNIHHPLNEFILIGIEYGMIISVLVLGFLLTAIIKSFCSKRAPSFEGGMILAVVAIYAFFSYPLKYPFTWLMVILALGLSLSGSLRMSFSRQQIIAFCSVLAVAGVTGLITLAIKTKSQIQWKNASTADALEGYERSFQALSNDYRFLYDFACVAYDKMEYNKALSLAFAAKQHVADYNVQMLIADAQLSLGNTADALESYWRAHDMCPSRIAPYYEAYMIHRSRGDTTCCVRLYSMANRAVKINNGLTEAMLYEMKKDISHY